jgi:hypothetical protein
MGFGTMGFGTMGFGTMGFRTMGFGTIGLSDHGDLGASGFVTTYGYLWPTNGPF